MTWPVSTIVVCVDASPGPIPVWYIHLLKVGSYYTIASCYTGIFGPGVFINEIPGEGFIARRFRKAESTHGEAGTVRAQEPVRA